MYSFQVINELYLKAEGEGILFAKKGSMVSDIGDFKYTKRLLGTNSGSLMSSLKNHLVRKFTGENLEIMEVSGRGIIYFADNSNHIAIIDLEESGDFNSLYVESENILAFTENCLYGVATIPAGGISKKGLFTSKLTYNGKDSKVAIMTNGNPLILKCEGEPITVDPDCLVAWTGKAPMVDVNMDWKAMFGQTSGESYNFEFTEVGQYIIIQPQERKSEISIKDKNRPTYNVFNGL